MAGRRPLVKAKVDGTEMPFLADSGALVSMITPASATEMKLARRPAPKGVIMSGIGGSFAVEFATVPQFGLAGHIIAKNFLVGGSESGAAGLLGQDVLAAGDTEYDLGGGMIRLVQPTACTETGLVGWAGGKRVSVIDLEPFTASQRHVLATATINGTLVQAVFDTGAPTTLLSLAAAKRAGIEPGDPGVIPAGTTAGLGGKLIESWIAPAVHYRLGGVEIIGDPLRIADTGAVPFELLIGADFFLAHRVLVAKSQQRFYFVDMTGAPGQPLPALADAEAYSRRGAALAARRDLANATDDFTRAIALAPDEAHYLVQRAKVYLDRRELLLARHDLDLAVAKKPGFVEALLTRATLNVVDRDFALTRQDLAAASRAASEQSDDRFAIAALYAVIEDWRASVAQFDYWIAAHPGDYRQGTALNARCWAHAMLNEALSLALDDCNEALRLQPNEFAYLDSRGLVELRLGRLDRAIADYDAALGRQAGLPWSLFGRGLAERRKGKVEAGSADIAAAIRIAPDMPQKAVEIGLIQSASDPR
jgi:tetratricopeptide (TPR) repeat protein